ncbi:unnamed protein product [Rotaria sp. Silwood1]|nr:unnamed protein product [Rotaria sp. Silwood1]CAF3850901.1 unnamed protein product [Rotaria sp. Silwood1]CAF3852751.1 unnamed protein product [Rotaria sp. Silwood1]
MKQPTIEQSLTIHKDLTADQSTAIKDLIARWICTDIRPFGSLYGNIDVDNILRSRNTISNHIYKLADVSRQQIKLILQEPYESGCLSISPDFWSDKYRQISYLGVTATFTDFNYHYHTIDLLCRPFGRPDKSSTNVLTKLPLSVRGIEETTMTIKVNAIPPAAQEVIRTIVEYDDNHFNFEEDEGLKYIRERTSVLFSNMLELDSRHYCATILHPDYRTLRGCSTHEKMMCHQFIREKLKNMHQPSIKIDSESQKNKRLKTDQLSILDDFKDDPEASENDDCSDDDDVKSVEYSLPITKSDELNKYLSMKVDMKQYSFDILEFWQSNADEFPCLSRLAREIHSIPATSAVVERQFSIAGLAFSERRNSLDPEQLDNIICIRAIEKIKGKI